MVKHLDTGQKVLLLTLALIGGLVFNYLFYGNALGISYPLFVSLIYGFFFAANHKVIDWDSVTGWFVTGSALILSFTYLFFANQTLSAINFLLIPALVITSFALFTKQHEYHWYDPRFVFHIGGEFLINFFSHIYVPASIIRSFDTKNSDNKTLRNILIGLVISVPLLLVIISLLGSADAVFGELLSNTFNKIGSFDGDLVGQFVVVMLATIALASVLYIFSKKSDSHFLKPLTDIKTSIDSATTSTVLVLLNLVYLLFVGIQFSYLFLGGDLSFLENYTFAEYARRGFGELMAITFINLSIIVGVTHFTKQKAIFTRVMATVLMGLSTIILFSSFYRLAIYEQTYGFSLARLFAHTIVITAFFLFIFTVIKVWQPKLNLLKYYLATGLIIYVVLNYVNVDHLVAKYNIERYYTYQSEDLQNRLDVSYFNLLAPSAQIPLQEVANSNAAIGKKAYQLRIRTMQELKAEKYQAWPAFNFSRDRFIDELGY